MSRRTVPRVGIDLVDVARIRRLAWRFGRGGLARLFTARELDYAYASSRLCYQRLAARLAAKEAFIKAWGVPVPLRKIEVVKREGVPFIHHAGYDYPVSISHTKEIAVAVTAWETSGRGPQARPQGR
ncbi:MAG: 4'-phosphopantetheinyl transferase superfamily protein [Candidatus Bipolaricaulota bacterium]